MKNNEKKIMNLSQLVQSQECQSNYADVSNAREALEMYLSLLMRERESGLNYDDYDDPNYFLDSIYVARELIILEKLSNGDEDKFLELAEVIGGEHKEIAGTICNGDYSALEF